MNLPDIVGNYLDRQRLSYRLIACPTGESLAQAAAALGLPSRWTVRTVLLRDASGLLMAILPCDYILDFSMLCQSLGRDLEPLHSAETASVLQNHGCKAGSHPPLPGAFDIPALADDSLIVDDAREIYFDGGNGETLIGMRGGDFRRLLARARWERFAVPIEHLDSLSGPQALTPQNLHGIIKRYTPAQPHENNQAITELPAMPPTAQRLLMLRANPAAEVRDILQIIEQDPSLVAQVVYWARSPLHGHYGVVDSLETAIGQVLGIENTLNLLLGSSLGRVFHIPADGPVGSEAFWRHSIYCAALVGELVKVLPQPSGVEPGLAYLCGLLHDFGYLVLGQAFPAHFFLFNRFIAVNRHIALSAVERYVLGVEHWHIGAWLMQSWGMPEEVIVAVRWHHHEDCPQPHAEYAHLVLIANRLLDHIGLGEGNNHRLPALAMFMLGITHEQASDALARVQSSAAALDSLAGALRLPAEG